MKAPIKLILAEDHLVVREGIRKLLEVEEDFTVIAEAKTGREAVEQVFRLRPDVVVMDIAMPLLNGLDACRQITTAGSATRVLILSAYGEDAYIEGAVQAGAAGFVLKHAPGSALAHAIREVGAGRRFFSEAILRRYRDAQIEHPKGAAPQKRALLTRRESEVLQLVAEGKANKETAVELGISIKTVEKHRSNLMRKLNIHDTASLTRHAIAVGMVESSSQESRSRDS